MQVFNISKQTQITDDLKKATSFIDRGLGLLKPSNPRSLLFKTRFGIHTLGLKETIDVIVLDKHKRIVKLKTGLKPMRFFFWHPKYFWVMEVPHGIIAKSETEIGDSLKFETEV